MNQIFTKSLSLGAIALAAACASAPKQNPAPLPATIEDSVNSPYRALENRARDVHRHPTETLTFFEIAPEMRVVEIWPSGGWYTEILAPYLASKGQYIIAEPSADPKGYNKKRTAWMTSHPEIAQKVMVTQFAPPEFSEVAPAGTVDRVLTFRNVHSWQGEKGKLAAFKGFYTALKPGGILGVVEHRAAPKGKFDASKGYIRESEVIRLAQKAGFKLLARSEINANPKDTKNYSDGVWALPPTLKQGDKDRAERIAIGESDRMTLKFVKPSK